MADPPKREVGEKLQGAGDECKKDAKEKLPRSIFTPTVCMHAEWHSK